MGFHVDQELLYEKYLERARGWFLEEAAGGVPDGYAESCLFRVLMELCCDGGLTAAVCGSRCRLLSLAYKVAQAEALVAAAGGDGHDRS